MTFVIRFILLTLSVGYVIANNVRIHGGGSSGRLEAFVRGKWGSVCDDSFDDNNNAATVACKQMGFSSFVHLYHFYFVIMYKSEYLR